MAENPKICRYIDIPLQHIADPVLEAMHRGIDGALTRALIRKMREKVPGVVLRTTMMVGHPGEGRKEFLELLDFVREARFERLGAFAYSEENGTWAAKNLSDDIPQEVKQDRLQQLMALQEQISLDIQEQKVGQTLRVIVDREEEEYYVGRTQWDSPEVDPEVLINKDKPLTIGQFTQVHIEQALPFELIGSCR